MRRRGERERASERASIKFTANLVRIYTFMLENGLSKLNNIEEMSLEITPVLRKCNQTKGRLIIDVQ